MANRVCYRSVDEHGAELDVQIQKQRNKARRQAFLQTCGSSSPVPRKIVTDQLRGYPVAKAEVSELAIVKYVSVKAAGRLNNCAENSH